MIVAETPFHGLEVDLAELDLKHDEGNQQHQE